MSVTISSLQAKKTRGEKIAVLTAYDCPTARLEDEAGIDMILVGDSVGTNVLGYVSETEVSIEDMLHHVKAVRRGTNRAYVLADLPFGTYSSPDLALKNSEALRAVGADGVKIEGALPEIVKHLSAHNIEVCGHLGFTPQTIEKAGLQAKTADAAEQLLRDATELENAGAKILVLEMVPEEVGRFVTATLSIPTIGIGAGRYTDGQVLVVNDVLGINSTEFRHNKRFANLRAIAAEGIGRYLDDVRGGKFPAEENVRHMSEDELQKYPLNKLAK